MIPPLRLDNIAFREPQRARKHFGQLENASVPGILERVRLLLNSAPDPDRALDYLVRLAERNSAAFSTLASSATGLQSLVAVFCYSRFLSEEVLQRPEWIDEICSSGALYKEATLDDLLARLHRAIPEGVPGSGSLARFRKQEILRILLRDVRGLTSLAGATAELSLLADAILDFTYRRIRASMEQRHGVPMFCPSEGAARICGFSILAMGKLGGEELNYSSDIDLMFVYSASGETTGPRVITNQEFFKGIAATLTELLSSYSPDGMCYRVDLRLRPDGRLGELALSVDAAKRYYQTRGRDWELQMLIKARVAAGEPDPGRMLLDFVEPSIYATTLDFTAIEHVAESRTRIHENLAKKQAARKGHQAEIDVKLSLGGIRDIEFLVQCLQRLHGGREPWVRHGGTLLALSRLRDKGLLSAIEYARLTSAYQFLRIVEHRLQLAEDRQTHSLPTTSPELEEVARCMPPDFSGHWMTGGALISETRSHLQEVAEIYDRVIHVHQPEAPRSTELPSALSNLLRLLVQTAPAFANLMFRRGMRRGVERLERFVERIRQRPELVGLMNRDLALASRVIDIFELSPFLSEEVLRTPEFLHEFALFGSGITSPPEDATASNLRLWFRREMFRTQAESVCLSRPVFETLDASSALAERAIGAAYRLAVKAVLESFPPQSVNYRPRQQMIVVALGRLGIREFDLASDADLIFVIPNRDAAETPFWTRTAEKLIDILSAYSGDGRIFAVDARLRPNGREGALVQTEGAFRKYFERGAQAWEGMAYMKSHPVAGDLSYAGEFLNALQDLDWRRYGQSGRSRVDLRRMRARLEKEIGDSNPLKAGVGAYYDIDFTLMYLRLKSAGIFFQQMNTPKRIEVVEKMGHLDRRDASFLVEAATFYRAVDHGLRIIHGHAEGAIPRRLAELEILEDLMRRWRPVAAREESLQEELERVRKRTRDVFNRLFGEEC